MSVGSVAFRFDADAHAYFLGDQRVPSATQLIEMGGLVTGAQYFTDQHRRRGSAVHDMATDFDLGALRVEALNSPFKGYVLAYVAACQSLKPTWTEIEIADVHPVYRYGVRTDRKGTVYGRRTVTEIKSGGKAKHHAVQTALQALADEVRSKVPHGMIQRLTVYVKPSGKWSVECHEDARDFDVARDLIRRFCR